MNYRQEIQRMKQGGYSITDTYIYVKDYIEFETLIELWETEVDVLSKRPYNTNINTQ